MTAMVALFLTTTVHGHMIMANPVPYGYQTIDNSPLTGTNYPCKVTSDPATFYSTDGIDNTYAAGSSQTLSFKGSAVHGGGSCQLAITNDLQPSASTDWRVILSIESGCPSTGGDGPSTYNWTVPAELEPGQYSFAWTWISKLAGQPEYYMNCAPITVTAATAASRMARRDAASYPELFVANLDAINSCKTEPSTDPVFPDPGPDVEKLLDGDANFATITQSGCVPLSQTQGNAALPVATAGGSGSGSGSGSANTTTAAAAETSSSSAFATSSSSTSSSAASIPGGSFATATQAPSPSTFATSTAAASSTTSQTLAVIPVTPTLPSSVVASSATAALSSSSAAASSSSTAVEASSTAEASSTVEASSTASSGSSSTLSSTSAAPTVTGSGSSSGSSSGSGSSNSTGSTGSGSAKSGTCTQEGMFNCVGSKYQQCASGSWTSMQALPGGTTCTQGESTGLWARGSLLARRIPRGRMATF